LSVRTRCCPEDARDKAVPPLEGREREAAPVVGAELRYRPVMHPDARGPFGCTFGERRRKPRGMSYTPLLTKGDFGG